MTENIGTVWKRQNCQICCCWAAAVSFTRMSATGQWKRTGYADYTNKAGMWSTGFKPV